VFDEKVIQGTTYAVHRYLDAMMLEQIHVFLVAEPSPQTTRRPH